jgi:uncharacterized membrane protein
VISFSKAIKFVLIAAAGVAYVSVSYYASISDHPSLAAILPGIVPLSAAALVTAWNSRIRIPALILFSICALAFILNFEYLRSHAAWLYFVQHVGAMLLLATMFGSSLGRGHAEALCSRIASFAVHERLDAEYLQYTWKVTLIWTIYFIISAIISVLLFFSSLQAWSFFANLLTPVLLGIMFVGEYLIRLRVLPNRAHFSVSEIIHAYRKYSRHRPRS